MREILRRHLLFLIPFVSLLGFGAQGAQFVELELTDGKVVSGEFIKKYEDRWFYEAPSPHVAEYVLLFKLKEDGLIFHFHSVSEINTKRRSLPL